MSNLVLIYQNYVDSADIYDGSYNPAFPLTNLKDDDIGVVARTNNTLNSSSIIIVNMGAARQIGGIALGPCNITPGASFEVKVYSDAGLTNLLHDSTLHVISGSVIDWSDQGQWPQWEAVGFWEGIADILNQDEVPVWLIYIPSTPVTGQFWRINIFDTTNADGYIQYGRLIMGRIWRPSINYLPDDNSFIPNQPIVDVSESLGGKRTFWRRGKRRTARFAFRALPEAELFSDVFRLANLLGSDRQCFIVPDPSDTANLQKRSFLATLKTPPPLVQANVAIGSTAIDAEEVI